MGAPKYSHGDGVSTGTRKTDFQIALERPEAFDNWKQWTTLKFPECKTTIELGRRLADIIGGTQPARRSLVTSDGFSRLSVDEVEKFLTKCAEAWGLESPVQLLYPPPLNATSLSPKEAFRSNLEKYLLVLDDLYDQGGRRWLAERMLPKTASKTKINNRVTLLGRWLESDDYTPSRTTKVTKQLEKVSGIDSNRWFAEELSFDHLKKDPAHMFQVVLQSEHKDRLLECLNQLYSELIG